MRSARGASYALEVGSVNPAGWNAGPARSLRASFSSTLGRAACLARPETTPCGVDRESPRSLWRLFPMPDRGARARGSPSGWCARAPRPGGPRGGLRHWCRRRRRTAPSRAARPASRLRRRPGPPEWSRPCRREASRARSPSSEDHAVPRAGTGHWRAASRRAAAHRPGSPAGPRGPRRPRRAPPRR